MTGDTGSSFSNVRSWILEHFGTRIADPVRLHVAAKRYLCTEDPEYLNKLSPTSKKSFFDQGGAMNRSELNEFEAEPHFKEAVRLRTWDDTAKDADKITQELEYFLPMIESCIKM